MAAMLSPDTPSANGTMANAALHAASVIIVAGDETPCATLPVTLKVTAHTIRYRAAGAGFHAIIAQIVPNTTNGPSQYTVASSSGVPFHAGHQRNSATSTPRAPRAAHRRSRTGLAEIRQ
ncbi:hypothetical protein GOSPT_099_00530 [Gordonia sputi NBRC 100414]|uniref:Uncharacterized protein n=1 Tax=Gordonia sputi NBRC 100414 TaxID=1089453 RepID=H5U3U6_9ACTN|nr:hypothetical protein GOSPT_099_00530 [Gordonia sputi NBRC 100414]